MLRWRQITSSRISAGRWLASIAPATVSIVAGASSCPRSIRPTSSSTTVGGAADLPLVSVERQHVAAQVQIATDPALELAQHGVLGSRQLGGHRVVER